MEAIVEFMETIGEELPLELFVFVGTFIEELFTPIPSFLVLVPAGAAAKVQDVAVWYLTVLAVISAAGRLLGAILLYWLADKFEDVLLGKGRNLFGYNHDDIENLGTRLSGTKRDWLVLLLLNMLPFIPPVIPLACGFLKVRFVMFATTTFFGNIVSAASVLAIGYAGLQVASEIRQLELAGQILMGIVVAGVAVWLVWRYLRSKRKSHESKGE